jgi:hypothetical protein
MGLANRIAGAVAILIGLSVSSAQAGYIVDLTQQGSDVVATGSGTIDLTGLSFQFSFTPVTFLSPIIGFVVTGPLSEVDYYAGITGPTSFGSGGASLPTSSASGDPVGVEGAFRALFVPAGYVSGNPLSDTATYDGQTFATLGVTPGRYEWTWGTGANQNFTLDVGTVPEPSTWAMVLLGFAGLGFMGKAYPSGSGPTIGSDKGGRFG